MLRPRINGAAAATALLLALFALAFAPGTAGAPDAACGAIPGCARTTMKGSSCVCAKCSLIQGCRKYDKATCKCDTCMKRRVKMANGACGAWAAGDASVQSRVDGDKRKLIQIHPSTHWQ
jgi:hypothetical protein